ncbi:MAG TPA: DUF2341 domain-containing protein [Kofleriaceae bacterium]
MRIALLALLTLVTACPFDRGYESKDANGGGSDDGGSNAGSDAGSDAGSGSGSDAMTTPLREKPITITGLVVGTHTDFPLWLSLTDPQLAARARPDGTDIHFVAGTTQLDYQIQSWTKSSGRLDAWVRVPSLAMGTQIAMRYGDVTVAHAPDAPGTFAGYAAVWHFDDALNNATVADARNQTNGTAVSLNAGDSVAAQLGRGFNFTDGNDQVTFTNPLTGNTSHTISAWINQRTTTTNDAIIALGETETNQARWFHSRFNTATIAVGFYNNDYPDPNEDVIGGGWVLLHWVYDGTNRQTRLYRNAALVAGPFQHGTGVNTQGNAGSIGNAASGFGQNMGINATLDEVRIINVARGSTWLAAEALNQATPAMFYTVGVEQAP